VIATYLAGIPELVRPGENGWLVPAGDVGALRAALEDLLWRPIAELQAMGEAGRKRVAEKHSIDGAAEQLAAIFRESCR
jgi:glycosyltransferase involved in cell wall biosynthesis